MEVTFARLRQLIEEVPNKITNFTESELSQRTGLNKWSKQEILGHLCDSATNNHHRIVKLQFSESPFPITAYAQEQWVGVQNYQAMTGADILELWLALNKHILRLITNLPDNQLARPCDLGEGKTATLAWLIQDYLAHLEHHLGQIFGGK